MSRTCCPRSHGLWAKKSFKLMWRCHQLLSGFLANGHLPRVSRQSCLLTNDKSENEMIPGAVHIFPGIYLTAGENLGKPQLGDYSMKVVR